MIARRTMTVDTAAESPTQPADPLETPLAPVGTSGPTPATVSVCFTPAEECTGFTVAAIDSAREEIRV